MKQTHIKIETVMAIYEMDVSYSVSGHDVEIGEVSLYDMTYTGNEYRDSFRYFKGGRKIRKINPDTLSRIRQEIEHIEGV